ncbi:hypothetical protein, conserved [Eimeria maxima]|uniref:RAP domain-containing protein n=1 Tax=Eimeria maxima TaxID=5804 RepID=U6M9T8_EIMMA|nr:hypothetical protein, conserved [Eimeria maxima]CDJ59808.1 hypothetical protein, conserved [Eimeria maxima]
MGLVLLWPSLLQRCGLLSHHTPRSARLLCHCYSSSCSPRNTRRGCSTSSNGSRCRTDNGNGNSNGGFTAARQHSGIPWGALVIPRILTAGGAARLAETAAKTAGKSVAKAGDTADGKRDDVKKHTLTSLRLQLAHARRLLLEASTTPEHQQQQQTLLPGIATAEEAPATVSGAAAAAAVASSLRAGRSLLLHLQRRQQAASAQGCLIPHTFALCSNSSSSENNNRSNSKCWQCSSSISTASHEETRRLLLTCLQLLAAIVRSTPCHGRPEIPDIAAAATTIKATAAATTIEATAAATTIEATAAAHVEAARVAVLLLQCLLHAKEARQLQHIQAATDCLEAAANQQLHLQQHCHQQQQQPQQQQQQQQQVDKQNYLEALMWQQQTELAVLLKRSVRLLAALLNRLAKRYKRQQHQQQQKEQRKQQERELRRNEKQQTHHHVQQEDLQSQQQHQPQQQQLCSPAFAAEWKGVSAVAATSALAGPAAAAALSSVQRLIETAARLVQHSLRQQQLRHQQLQQQQCQQQLQQQQPQEQLHLAEDRRASTSVGGSQHFAATASIDCWSLRTDSVLPAPAATVTSAVTETAAAAAAELKHLSPLLLWLLPSVFVLAQQAGKPEVNWLWRVASLLVQQQQQHHHQQQLLLQHQLQLPELSLLLFAATRLCSLHSAQQQQLQDQLERGESAAVASPSAAAAAVAATACRLQLLKLASWCSFRAAALLSGEDCLQAGVASGVITPSPLVAQQQKQQLLQSQRPWLRPSCVLLLGLTRLLQQEQLLLPGSLLNSSVQQALLGTHVCSSWCSSSNCSSSNGSTHSRKQVMRSSPNTSELAAAAASFLKALDNRLVAGDWLQQSHQQKHQQRLIAGMRGHAGHVLADDNEATALAETAAEAARATAADGACKREQLFFSGRDFVHLLRCFVSARYLSDLMLHKALSFLAANPPVVQSKHSQQQHQQQQKEQQQQQQDPAAAAAAPAETLGGMPLLLSPQDAALLLWAVGTAAPAAVSRQLLQRRMQGKKGFLFKISTAASHPFSGAVPAAPAAASSPATTAAAAADSYRQTRLSPEVQYMLRRHFRALTRQLLLSNSLQGSGSAAVACGQLATSSSNRSSNDGGADSQAIANAVWGLTCCGLLQYRLLRTYCTSPSFWCCFRSSSTRTERRQLLQAALLLRLQRVRAPYAVSIAAASPSVTAQRRYCCAIAANGLAAEIHRMRPSSIGSHRWKLLQWSRGRRRARDSSSCVKETTSGVRPSLLQQQVLRVLQRLLQRSATAATRITGQQDSAGEPAAAASSISKATAAATTEPPPVPIRTLHECSVGGGLLLDIALLEQQQKQKQQNAAAGRRRTCCSPLRIAVEVDGPSHFLLSVRAPQQVLVGEQTPQQLRSSGLAASSNDCSNGCSSSSSSNNDRNSVVVELRSDGGTALKHRLLLLLGYRVTQICFLEWQHLQREEQKQQLLLQQPPLQQLLRGQQTRGRAE